MTIDGSSLLVADKIMENIHVMFSPENRENLPMRYRILDSYERYCGVYIKCMHCQDGSKSKLDLHPLNIIARDRIIPALEFVINEHYADEVEIEILPIPDPNKKIFSIGPMVNTGVAKYDTMWYEW